MADEAMEQDVNQAETETAVAPSSEDKTTQSAEPQTDAVTEESAATDTPVSGEESDEGERIPYNRFKEVNDRLKETERELERLKTQSGDGQQDQQQSEQLDPQSEQIKARLRQMGFVTREEQEAELQRQRQDLQVQKEIEELSNRYDGKDGRPKFNKEDVVEFALEKQIGDLEAAYKLKHESDLMDWKVKQALKKTKGVKSETSDGSGSSNAGTTDDDLKSKIRDGDKSALRTYLKRRIPARE